MFLKKINLTLLNVFYFCVKINSIPTKPIEGQKTGTSGLRKKVGICSIHIQPFDSLCLIKMLTL